MNPRADTYDRVKNNEAKMALACGKDRVTKSYDTGFGPNLLGLLQSAFNEQSRVSLGTLYSDLVAIVQKTTLSLRRSGDWYI